MSDAKGYVITMLVFEIVFMLFSIFTHGAESAVYFVGSIMCLGIVLILSAIDQKQTNHE